MITLVSKKAGKAISFDDPNDAGVFKDAVEMVNTVSSFRNTVPSDWQDYTQGSLQFSPPSKPDYRQSTEAFKRLTDEVDKDEPDVRSMHENLLTFINNTAFDIKRTKMKENKKQKIREGLADLAAKAEQDHEVQMARSELYKLSKYSIKLHDLLKSVSESEGLQAWQQSYITKAADYIDAVYHDLSYEKSMGSEISADIGKSQADAMTAESRAYYADLYQKLAEEIRHTQDPSGVGYFKIIRKPKGFRVMVGLGGDRLTSRNAEHVSGDLPPNQVKREVDRVKDQLNLKDMKPYDEKTEKILSKL